MKRWIIFIISIFLAIFFVWFGIQLLTLANQPVTTNQLFFLGCACILGGVLAVSTKPPKDTSRGSKQSSKGNFLAAGGLLLVGAYYFARAAGLIENSVLVRLLGLASFIAALVLVLATLPWGAMAQKQTDTLEKDVRS